MASALPVGFGTSRSALWQAAAFQYFSICGTEIRAQGPQFVPPESADQAIAKVLPFPAPTDCKSADECVPRDNWFEGSAGHARS